ncbi:unnamed protein product [Paramecium sonneborni]|uniref:VWFA domain-containing protein n=1 Tax=Paramecium sonneborni TaxID=65129 RepID=A0A8S1P7B3_9CILI|nr:unnamed protein product [Paramecium sonneborni]
MQFLQNFLIDQIQQYEFCQEKCKECHLYCKHFKNHIEISQKYREKLNYSEDQLNQKTSSKIKNTEDELQKRKTISEIEDQKKDAEQTLEKLQVLNKIFNIQIKLKEEMNQIMNYDFYDKERKCINLQVLGLPPQDKEKSDKGNLNNEQIELLQIQFSNQIEDAEQNKKSNTLIKESKNIQLQQHNKNLILIENSQYQSQENIKNMRAERDGVKLKKDEVNKNLSSLQNQIQEINISDDILDINQLKLNIDQENENLEEIKNKIVQFQENKKQKILELEVFQKQEQRDLKLNLDYEYQLTDEYFGQIDQLENEIKSLKKKKNNLEELKQELKEEQDKKFRQSKTKIEELTKKLKEQSTEEIDYQIKELQIKKLQIYEENQSKINEENYEIYKICKEELSSERENLQEDGDLGLEKELIELFKKKKQECLDKILFEIQSFESQTQEIENKIINFSQSVKKINKKKSLQDTYQICQSDFNNLEKQLQEIENKLLKNQDEFENNKIYLEAQRKLQESISQEIAQFEKQEIEIDQQIKKLNIRLDQLKGFEQHQKMFIIETSTLENLQLKLKQWDQFESYNIKNQEEIKNLIKNLDKKINDLSTESELLTIELSKFNLFEMNKEKLDKIKNSLKQLDEQKLQVHQCQRESHKCDKNCQICPEQKCDNKAGHQENQEHLCSKQDHKCNNICQVFDCKSNCMKGFKHNNQHNCENQHPCKEKCKFCNDQCQKDRSNDHNDHNCMIKYCIQTCNLCKRKCFKEHEHSLNSDNHFCENPHQCEKWCEEKGICKIDYETKEIIQKNQSSEFSFIKYQPVDIGKQKCQKQIPAGENQHQGPHICKNQTSKQFHNCDQQCPECNTYCDLKYGHKGLHSSDRHRNKENQQFTIQEGIQVKIEIQETNRKYEIGDSSEPESCDLSCKRKGRAHFHLVKCQGKQQCLAKQNDQFKARHSEEKYVGFEDCKFDEVLCIDFWKYYNWSHPIMNESAKISRCNYYCPLCNQQNGALSFCNQEAWHTQDERISSHGFDCFENHKNNPILGINIAFVIDTTSSMQRYIELCKNTIIEIMSKCRGKQNINGEEIIVNFAVVSYQDHDPPYSKQQQILKIQDFTTDKIVIQFLNKLKAEGGEDGPEAVMDGLNASLGLKWNQNYEKLLYLIADGPPHGTQYSNYLDYFPDGCPCGLRQENIFKELSKLKVKLQILKLNQMINGMIAEFKKDYKNLSVITPQNKDENLFQDLMVDEICKYLTNNEITFQMRK